MSIFYPEEVFDKISDIKLETLEAMGISALILDVDNTLATHGNPVPDKDVLSWLKTMKQGGVKLIIASNNKKERVAPFARKLGLEYMARAMKPFPIGFLRVSKKLGLPAKCLGVVGDQIFTDVLGGNLAGAKTLLVKPLSAEEIWSIRVKRNIENLVLKGYNKKRKRKDLA